MLYLNMVSVDHHRVNRLGSWKFRTPSGEASGIEPAHVHAMNTQRPEIYGKIWIGVDEKYPVKHRLRYIFVPKEDTLPISAREMDELLEILSSVFEEDINGFADFFENKWTGGWYRDV